MMDKYSFRHLDWDTDFFGEKSAKVTLNDVLDEAAYEKLVNDCKDYSFVTIENACGSFENDVLLGKMPGAYITDCPVVLKKAAGNQNPEDYSGFGIRLAEEADLPELMDLAGSVFRASRFYNDPYIPAEKAGELYSQWVKNSFYDDGKLLYTTEERNGFLIFTCDDNEGCLNLLAAGGKNRKKGVGSALVKFADNYVAEKGCKELLVGTQATNIAALNLYIKCGFKMFRTTRTYHLRNK